MSELIYKNRFPSSGELHSDLERAWETASLISDLLSLADELREFELQYGMSSEEFYMRFQAGILDDELQHCMEWTSAYDMFVKTRRLIETSMMHSTIQFMPRQEVMA